ncbi:MAG: 2-oxoacid:acceptor oxidoreductase family protein [Desulfomonilaceae bacterium]|nr:2-oxoacid:acceptor oxidoreductase family protein [Desulfomonilaceae bacterium]
MKEIKIFGRGGQGAVTAAQVLAVAAFLEGRWAQTFPQFGAERRGAPVIAYVRWDGIPIVTRNKVYSPDVVMVMDFNLFRMSNPLADIKPGGTAIINHPGNGSRLSRISTAERVRLFTIDATAIAHELYGKTTIPITNIIHLGAYCAANQDISVESVCRALPDFFPRNKLEVNQKAAREGYENLRGVS